MQGRVGEALTQAKQALDAHPAGWQTYLRSAYGAIAFCHLQIGELDHAEKALSVLGHPEMRDSVHGLYLLEVRAQLRLAQRRPSEALADATEAGRRLHEELGFDSPASCRGARRRPSHTSRLAIVQPRAVLPPKSSSSRARELRRVAIRDLRVLGMAHEGQRRLEVLRGAVDLGAEHPTRLEYIHALVDFGAALRRANHRIDAREPLRRALELSQRGGIKALVERVGTELRAAGARPRRAMLTGIEALTTSELRVSDLAAAGLTTRQIAEALFVSPKTVEFHLRGAYRKLEVNTRAELAEALRKRPASQAA